jgi:hypothetical protein
MCIAQEILALPARTKRLTLQDDVKRRTYRSMVGFVAMDGIRDVVWNSLDSLHVRNRAQEKALAAVVYP